MEKSWDGAEPDACDICDGRIPKTFVDGATRMGPWAVMCPACHASHGVGLGTGRGQKYVKDGNKFIKVEGGR